MSATDIDHEARQRIGDLEGNVRQLVELAELQAARIDALEAQRDRLRDEPGWDVSESAAQSLGVKAGRYVLVPR